jgi:hypothetical protein
MMCHQHKYHLARVVSLILCKLRENSLCYTSSMAKKVTLATIASMLTEQGEEIKDLTETGGFVVKHMATKDDVADLRRELKGDIAAVQSQVNSIEQQLRETRIEVRLGSLEEKVFGAARR